MSRHNRRIFRDFRSIRFQRHLIKIMLKADIGNETTGSWFTFQKNEPRNVFLIQRFESADQKSCSSVLWLEAQNKKDVSWLTGSNQWSKDISSRFFGSNQYFKKVVAWFIDSKKISKVCVSWIFRNRNKCFVEKQLFLCQSLARNHQCWSFSLEWLSCFSLVCSLFSVLSPSRLAY